MALVHRFYDVQDGAVLVGVPGVALDALGHHSAMVLQEPCLFTGTAKGNIRYSTGHASDETAIKATRAIGAHGFAMSLPKGYYNMLEERGSSLSLGQRQLLSFARALVADATILVLDEVTANIDSYTEVLIRKALQQMLQGRAGLVIAQRLATIRNADRTVVLQNGRLIDQGAHEVLMARQGLHARLGSLDYASFDDSPATTEDERVLAT